jgi:hypothetical protein
MPRGYNVRPYPSLHECPSGCWAGIRKRFPRCGIAGHDDSQDIQPLLLASHSLKNRSDLIVFCVVDADGYARSTGRINHFGGFFDRLWTTGGVGV